MPMFSYEPGPGKIRAIWLIPMIFVACLFMHLLDGCGDNQVSDQNSPKYISRVKTYLPVGSTNVKIDEHKWVEFDYKGQRFMKRTTGPAGSITIIGEAKGESK